MSAISGTKSAFAESGVVHGYAQNTMASVLAELDADVRRDVLAKMSPADKRTAQEVGDAARGERRAGSRSVHAKRKAEHVKFWEERRIEMQRRANERGMFFPEVPSRRKRRTNKLIVEPIADVFKGEYRGFDRLASKEKKSWGFSPDSLYVPPRTVEPKKRVGAPDKGTIPGIPWTMVVGGKGTPMPQEAPKLFEGLGKDAGVHPELNDKKIGKRYHSDVIDPFDPRLRKPELAQFRNMVGLYKSKYLGKDKTTHVLVGNAAFEGLLRFTRAKADPGAWERWRRDAQLSITYTGFRPNEAAW